MTDRIPLEKSYGCDNTYCVGCDVYNGRRHYAVCLRIITRKEESLDIKAIIDIVSRHRVKQIVVGLPFSMDGSVGEQAGKVKVFVQKLSSQTELPLEFRDERLSTVAANRLIRAATAKKTKRKAQDDAIAAALILQSYLDEEH